VPVPVAVSTTPHLLGPGGSGRQPLPRGSAGEEGGSAAKGGGHQPTLILCVCIYIYMHIFQKAVAVDPCVGLHTDCGRPRLTYELHWDPSSAFGLRPLISFWAKTPILKTSAPMRLVFVRRRGRLVSAAGGGRGSRDKGSRGKGSRGSRSKGSRGGS
jgi:hypothetical protein